MEFFEKTLAAQEVFQGKIVTVKVERVLLPDGRESSREIVVHRGAVALVPLLEKAGEKEIVLTRQYRKPVEEVLLEIPAGTLEEGEEPLVCAQRELREETGMKAEKLELIATYYSAPGFCTEKMYLYLATGLEPQAGEADFDEKIEVVKLPLPKALELVQKGEIKDGKSIIGILNAVYCSGAKT